MTKKNRQGGLPRWQRNKMGRLRYLPPHKYVKKIDLHVERLLQNTFTMLAEDPRLLKMQADLLRIK